MRKQRCRTKEYTAWINMKGRCYNPQSKYFMDYGGRGISVCKKWRDSFKQFLNDMGTAPTKEHSLDRFPNNNGNYEPSNCRWATYSEQNLNKRIRVPIEHNGEIKSLEEWAKLIGVAPQTIRYRIKNNKPIDVQSRKRKRKRKRKAT